MMEKGTTASVAAAAAAASPMGTAASASASMEELEQGNSVTLRAAETFLRLLPICLCVSALAIMLNNSQQSDYGSVSYTDLPAFRYLVNANGICAGYSLVSAAIVARPRSSSVPRAWTFFILDQVQTYMILVAVAMSTEVLYLAENGDASATWSSACGSFGRFCHKVTASVAITFVAVGCYVLLSLISSYRLFTKYDPPLRTPITTTGIDISTFHT